MAFDEQLAERIRKGLSRKKHIEKKMFGRRRAERCPGQRMDSAGREVCSAAAG